MIGWVSINGLVSPAAEARVSVFDRGFLFGDSVYEVLPRVAGRLVFWQAHVRRLFRSAVLVGIDLGVTPEALHAETLAVAERVVGDAYLQIIVSRGVGGGGLVPAPGMKGTRVIVARPLRRDPAIDRGYVLVTHGSARRDSGHGLSPEAKSGSRQAVVLALSEARARGADEFLRVDPLGRVLEGGTSSFFRVRAGVIRTPPLKVGILPGITRGALLDIAASAGLKIEEGPILMSELGVAEEVFLSSSTRGVVGVRRVDDWEYPCPGPLTLRLQAAYAAHLRCPEDP